MERRWHGEAVTEDCVLRSKTYEVNQVLKTCLLRIFRLGRNAVPTALWAEPEGELPQRGKRDRPGPL